MSQENNLKPTDLHVQPLYWGKPLDQLIDLEIIQVYQFCLQHEAKREEAKKKLLERKIKLPEINNPNYHNLKDAVLIEIEKRKITI